jgi:hypothetical protein
LSERCFALVNEIERTFLEGGLPSATKAKSISQAFFHFLAGKSEQESFDLLSMILEGKKTATELNYIPGGEVLQILYLLLQRVRKYSNPSVSFIAQTYDVTVSKYYLFIAY